ncbi:MAG: hypothetical protein M3118_02545, partial [Actinomycetota bacterium]|nr:hypothetical protein [Actinomycetota bacterium]
SNRTRARCSTLGSTENPGVEASNLTSDLPDLEPPTSNVRVEATTRFIEVPAAPANFFMLIGVPLFS